MKTLNCATGCLIALLLQSVIVLLAGAANERPNFVFIYTDDQRWDALGVVQREQGEKARFPWFQTPNLDRLASEGVRFRNAFVVNSLCSPSRAAYLTGRYSHANGVANNHTPFPARTAATWSSLLTSRPATRPATSASSITGSRRGSGRASNTRPASSARAATPIARSRSTARASRRPAGSMTFRPISRSSF